MVTRQEVISAKYRTAIIAALAKVAASRICHTPVSVRWGEVGKAAATVKGAQGYTITLPVGRDDTFTFQALCGEIGRVKLEMSEKKATKAHSKPISAKGAVECARTWAAWYEGDARKQATAGGLLELVQALVIVAYRGRVVSRR